MNTEWPVERQEPHNLLGSQGAAPRPAYMSFEHRCRSTSTNRIHQSDAMLAYQLTRDDNNVMQSSRNWFPFGIAADCWSEDAKHRNAKLSFPTAWPEIQTLFTMFVTTESTVSSAIEAQIPFDSPPHIEPYDTAWTLRCTALADYMKSISAENNYDCVLRACWHSRGDAQVWSMLIRDLSIAPKVFDLDRFRHAYTLAVIQTMIINLRHTACWRDRLEEPREVQLQHGSNFRSL